MAFLAGLICGIILILSLAMFWNWFTVLLVRINYNTTKSFIKDTTKELKKSKDRFSKFKKQIKELIED